MPFFGKQQNKSFQRVMKVRGERMEQGFLNQKFIIFLLFKDLSAKIFT